MVSAAGWVLKKWRIFRRIGSFTCGSKYFGFQLAHYGSQDMSLQWLGVFVVTRSEMMCWMNVSQIFSVDLMWFADYCV